MRGLGYLNILSKECSSVETPCSKNTDPHLLNSTQEAEWLESPHGMTRSWMLTVASRSCNDLFENAWRPLTAHLGRLDSSVVSLRGGKRADSRQAMWRSSAFLWIPRCRVVMSSTCCWMPWGGFGWQDVVFFALLSFVFEVGCYLQHPSFLILSNFWRVITQLEQRPCSNRFTHLPRGRCTAPSTSWSARGKRSSAGRSMRPSWRLGDGWVWGVGFGMVS